MWNILSAFVYAGALGFMFHVHKLNPRGRTEGITIKTNMSNAFDQMELDFVKDNMHKIEFSAT